MRARFEIDERKIRRVMERKAEAMVARAASVTQMRVKEGIALTDRIRTGRMLNGIEARRIAPLLYQVRSDEPYARYQEFGRGPVRPVRAKALRFVPKGANHYVFAQYVRADPGGGFFQRAMRSLSLRDFTG